MSKAIQTTPVTLRCLIAAQKAAPTPPVGPLLGARGVKSMDFCKEFNAKTVHLVAGTPTPTQITINPDRSFSFTTRSPPTTHLLKKVAGGIEKGTGQPGHETIATISVKHVYEVAAIKCLDKDLQAKGIENVARSVISTANNMGINVVY